MSGIQSKCTRHTRKQKNTAHNEDKNQSIKNSPQNDTDNRKSKQGN